MSRGRMRVLAMVLAAIAALGAVYAVVASGLWAGMIATTGGEAPKGGVGPGFIGLASFGAWRLICVAGPASGVATAAEPAKAKPSAAANACRLNQEVNALDRPGQVVAAANLSLVGPLRKPALMLRLPGNFHSGDLVSLRLGDEAIKTQVRDCTPDQCIAASALSESEWNHLIAAKAMQIVFPVGGQSAFVTLSVDGLSDAAAALERAEAIPSP